MQKLKEQMLRSWEAPRSRNLQEGCFIRSVAQLTQLDESWREIKSPEGWASTPVHLLLH